MGISVRIGIDTILGVDVGFDNKPLDFVTRGAQSSCAAANDSYFHRFIVSSVVVLFWRELAQSLRPPSFGSQRVRLVVEFEKR